MIEIIDCRGGSVASLVAGASISIFNQRLQDDASLGE